MNLSQQLDTLRGLVERRRAEQSLSPALIAELQGLGGQINTVMGPRNTVIHGMILKTDHGAFFARFAGRPPDVKNLLSADPAAIEKLAEDTLVIAKAIHRLIFKVQGYEPIESEDITLPAVIAAPRHSG